MYNKIAMKKPAYWAIKVPVATPAVIPRNHRVEEALAAAENGDFSVMNNLLKALANPFEHSDFQKEYSKPAPKSQCDYKTYCGT